MKLADLRESKEDEIRAWVKDHVQSAIEPTDNLIIHVSNGKWRVEDPQSAVEESDWFVIFGDDVVEIPYQMEDVDYYGAIKLDLPNLKSLKNLPSSLEILEIGNECKALESLDGIPKTLERLSILVTDSKLTSLEGIDKKVEHVKKVTLRTSIKSGLLSLLKIPGLQEVNTAVIDHVTNLSRACDIIANHIGKGRPGIVKAHQELIDADLEDFA